MFSYWAKPNDALELSVFLNDHIATIVNAYPKRFIGLGTIPLQSPDIAIKELERCMKIGLRGVQIGSHVNDWNLNAPELFPVFEAAQELGAAIFVHPWEMMGTEKMPRYWLPWLVGMPAETSLAICSMIFGGIFERLPNLKVAFAHGGGSFPSTIGRIEHGFNVRPDLVAIDNNVNPRTYLNRFYLDTLVHDPMMLDYLVKLMGADQLALGTDYPFPLGELQPGKLIASMPYSDSVKERMLSGSALEWLSMKKDFFV
jgi:aminocarboxymuconate-semialdehyde decarboxylase